jgi:hypothetical protein
MGTGIYRPPQWQQGINYTTCLLIFPGSPTPGQYSQLGISATLPNSQTLYVFDAVVRINHNQRIRITEHPVQTGANISDHAYIEPARVTLDIRMSDAMDSYSAGMWNGGPTKSVSAYQTLLALGFARSLLVLTTRLRTYTNVVIENIEADDTVKTIYGLSCRVTFKEIFLANTQTIVNSALPQTTQSTALGSVSSLPPTASQVAQYQIGAAQANALGLPPPPQGSPSAWSSVPFNNLQQISPGGP